MSHYHLLVVASHLADKLAIFFLEASEQPNYGPFVLLPQAEHQVRRSRAFSQLFQLDH